MRLRFTFILMALLLFGLADQIAVNNPAGSLDREIYVICQSECVSDKNSKTNDGEISKPNNAGQRKKLVVEEFCTVNSWKVMKISLPVEQKERLFSFSKLEKIVRAIKAMENETNLLA